MRAQVPTDVDTGYRLSVPDATLAHHSRPIKGTLVTVTRLITVLVIPPDQPPHIAVITPDLETLQSMVGGYIEAVRLTDGVIYCNEDGKRLGLPRNEPATTLARTTTPAVMNRRDVLVGTCIVVGNVDPNTGEPSEDEQDVPNTLVEILASQGWPVRQPD